MAAAPRKTLIQARLGPGHTGCGPSCPFPGAQGRLRTPRQQGPVRRQEPPPLPAWVTRAGAAGRAAGPALGSRLRSSTSRGPGPPALRRAAPLLPRPGPLASSCQPPAAAACLPCSGEEGEGDGLAQDVRSSSHPLPA